MLVSKLGSGTLPGNIVALNLDDDSVIRLEATVAEPDADSAFPRCGPPPERLRPRGYHVSDLADGGFRLLVINVAVSQRIERYRIDVDDAGPRMA